VRITLADLERYDATAPPARGDERRFCCPLEACAEKPIDASHRTFCLNVESGAWTCQRCHQSGKLDDGQDAPPQEQRERQRLQRAFAVKAPPAEAKKDSSWRSVLTRLVPLAGTPGQVRLDARAISWQAEKAGVRFSPDWFGRPAVVFPIRDRAGALVAAQGRYLDAEKPKTRDAGAKAAGVFATRGAWDADPLVLCEGPADALSLAAAGYPSIALLGCALSDDAAWSCALGRCVAVALDADAAGDMASAKMLPELQARGARVMRLRPRDGKDWNDMLLELGPEALGAELRAALEMPLDATQSKSGASGAPDGVSGHSDAGPVPEWNAEEQAVWDDTMRQCGACLADADFIEWVRVQWGCELRLDGAGKLKAVGAENVPPVVREEVKARQRMLVKHLQGRGD
jgi:hypothetical protein